VEADARRLGAAPVRVEGLTPAEAAPFSCPQAVEAPD
jgi:hypothetical protein